MAVHIDGFDVADPAHAWSAAGFTLDADGSCRVGGVCIRLTGPDDRGSGILGWSLRDLAPGHADIDGIPATPSVHRRADDNRAGPRPAVSPACHANGVTAIDHVVLLSPDLSRTVEAMLAVGVRPRRERDTELGGRPVRQVFFRMGEVVVEVVGSPEVTGHGPSTLWGITYVVADIDATAAYFGDRAAPVKEAVQPGRRITTLRHRDLGMSVPTAMISAPARR